MMSLLAEAAPGLRRRVLNYWPQEAAMRWIAAMVFMVAVSGIALLGLFKPIYNFDLVPYVASALENRIADTEALHDEAYKRVEREAHAGAIYELNAGNPYNLYQYEHPDGFVSQLGMYRVKIAYVWLMRALEPLVGLVNAAVLLSVLPALALGALCLHWLRQAGAEQGAILLLPVLTIGDFTYMTVTATPDLLLAFVAMAALYQAWRGRDWLAAMMLVLSVLVRPDNIVLVLALLIASVVMGWRVRAYAVAFAVALGLCLWIARAYDHPGWWAHFWFSCIALQNDMTGFDPAFSLTEMVRGYMRGLSVALRYGDWIMLGVALVAGWVIAIRAGRATDRRAVGILVAMLLGLGGKFISFPLPDDRYYFVFIAGMAVALIAMWKPRLDRP